MTTRQEIREILASGGLSLLFPRKDNGQRPEQHEKRSERREAGQQSGSTEPARRSKARAAG